MNFRAFSIVGAAICHYVLRLGHVIGLGRAWIYIFHNFDLFNLLQFDMSMIFIYTSSIIVIMTKTVVQSKRVHHQIGL